MREGEVEKERERESEGDYRLLETLKLEILNTPLP